MQSKPTAITKPPPLKAKADTYRHWQDILQSAGFPTDVIVLDFETFFTTEYSLRKLDTISYVMNNQFETLGMALAYSNTDNTLSRWVSADDVERKLRCMQDAWGKNFEGCTLVAQNARFDCAVLKWRYGICPSYIVDTMGLANHWDARAKNNLDDMSKRCGLPPKGDTLSFKDWTYRDRTKRKGGNGKEKNLMVPLPKITAEMDKELGSYANRDGDNTWEVCKWYLPRMSDPNTELHVMNHTLHLYLNPVFKVDVGRGAEIKAEMETELDRQITATGHTPETFSKDRMFEPILIAALDAAGDNAEDYKKKAKNAQGWKLATAKADPQRDRLLHHENKTVRELMQAKAALKSWPSHMTRIDSIIRQYQNAGNVLPVPLGYHGAHTGRWTGGEKLNLQNLGSRGHKLISRIRTMLMAPAGMTLVIADAASIESRVRAWISGQWDKCDRYRLGEEQYCAFAEHVLGKKPGTLRKPRDGGIPSVEAYFKWARNTIGKTGDLACGYQGGEKAVIKFAPDLDLETREKIKDKYRELHPEEVKFWHHIERKFLFTAKTGRPCHMARGLSFRQTPECNVIITLPSGREIKYHRVNVKVGKYGKDSASVWNDREKHWSGAYGGALTENVVQAMSRDILWGAIAELEERGLRVIHHIHDEIVACVPEALGQQTLDLAIMALRRVPDWAEGLPLDAEGIITPRYGSH
jgi:DNA polymerase